MADQYFAQQPAAHSEPRPFVLSWQGRDYRFYTDSGVFSKGELDYGSSVLLKALPMVIKGRVLDLGCGWGAIGLLIASSQPAATVYMVDINERAVHLARRNALENGLSVQIGQSDGFEQLQGSFDLIAFNPPIRAGKQVVYSLFRDCAKRLLPGGQLYVVMRRQQGADSAKKFLETIFGQVDTVAKKGGFHVFACGEGLQNAV